MEKLSVVLAALTMCGVVIAEKQYVLKTPTAADVVEGGKTFGTNVLKPGTIVQVTGSDKKNALTKEDAELRNDSFLGFKFKSREYATSPKVKKVGDGEYICKLEKPFRSFKHVKLSCTTNGALYGVRLEMHDKPFSFAEPEEHVVYTGSADAISDERESLASWVRDMYIFNQDAEVNEQGKARMPDRLYKKRYDFGNENINIAIVQLNILGVARLSMTVQDAYLLKIHKEEAEFKKKIKEEEKKAEELRKKAEELRKSEEAAAKEAENKAKWAAALAVKIPGYDPVDPAERSKVDAKIVAFLREYTGHSLGDDFVAAGFSTNESTVSFPARKPFGIFDVVEVSQHTKEGGTARPTGKIQSLCFRPSRKYDATNFTYETARKMMIQTGRDLARRVDLQEDYFDRYNVHCELEEKLYQQKSARKPYPNIKIELSSLNPRHPLGPRLPLRGQLLFGDSDPTAAKWLFRLTFDLSKEQRFMHRRESEDECIFEWREEQRQLAEIEKCYSHGIFVDEPKIWWTNQWSSAAPVVADIHFMTAFKQLTGFEIGQGYVSNVTVTTNNSMDCEIQEVNLPVEFCGAKKEHLRFKNGRLYGVCMQVPFCEASRKMEKRSARIVAADRDGIWNEMDALFDIGSGWTLPIKYGSRYNGNNFFQSLPGTLEVIVL